MSNNNNNNEPVLEAYQIQPLRRISLDNVGLSDFAQDFTEQDLQIRQPIPDDLWLDQLMAAAKAQTKKEQNAEYQAIQDYKASIDARSGKFGWYPQMKQYVFDHKMLTISVAIPTLAFVSFYVYKFGRRQVRMMQKHHVSTKAKKKQRDTIKKGHKNEGSHKQLHPKSPRSVASSAEIPPTALTTTSAAIGGGASLSEDSMALTSDSRTHLVRIFNDLDHDNDGFVALNEVKQYYKSILKEASPHFQDNDLVHEFPADDHAQISFTEWVDHIKSLHIPAKLLEKILSGIEVRDDD